MAPYLALVVAVMIVPASMVAVDLVLVYRPYSYLGLLLALGALAVATILHTRRREAAMEMPQLGDAESALGSIVRAFLAETAGTVAGLALLLLIAVSIFSLAGFIPGPYFHLPYTVHR